VLNGSCVDDSTQEEDSSQFTVVFEGPTLQVLLPPSPPIIVDFDLSTSTTFAKDRFSFQPAKYCHGELKEQVLALIHQDVQFQPPSDVDDIFTALWPGVDLVQAAPSPPTRVALGVVALCAKLVSVSPLACRFYNAAPKAPHLEFHLPNALFATLKYTAMKQGSVDARSFLLEKTLAKLESLSLKVPDIAKPPPNAPFPLLARFTHSLIDLFACTPRLTVDYSCTSSPTEDDDDDPNHHHSYSLQGHFLDALRVASDETASLAEILADYETELIQDDNVPQYCNLGHEIQVSAVSYGRPPPLLFFEAISSAGIPRSLLCENVMLGNVEYDFVAAVSMEPYEDDLVLEVEPIYSEALQAVALIVYCMRQK
jgi:hypothetical protein